MAEKPRVKSMEGESSSTTGPPKPAEKAIHWTDRLENYFAGTGEKAHGLSWLHKRAEAMYTTRRTYIDLPVIVLSSVTGFCSVGSQTLFHGEERLASIVLGVTSMFVGLLNTAGSYFGWAKRAEGHRISSIQYARLFRYISVELALPREERQSPHDFLKHVKDQYDRLQEISPLLPDHIIKSFQTKFADYTDISKPEETNGLEKIFVYKEGELPIPKSPGETRTNPFYRTLRTAMANVKRRTSSATSTPGIPSPPDKDTIAITIPTQEVPSS